MNDKRLLLMTKRELSRLDVIKDVLKKRITQKNAARQLNLSIRQVKRVVKRVKQDGDEGIISRKRLAPSNRKIPEAEKMEVLNLIRDKYYDFPPTLATEKLEELNNLVYSRETIRQWMIAEGLWKPKARKKIKKVFQQRKRRASAGELIQIDGSPHAWFEDRAPVCNMTVFIDDATGEYAVLMLSPSETLQAYQQAMYQYIKEYGKPRALYSDRHSIFKVNKGEMKETKVSQFGRAMKELDIELIFAATPEAKGRVERANQTLQNRLVKEFRLRNINTIEDANKFLKEYKYVLTNKFAKVARSSVDAHRSIAKSDEELLRILSRKEERIITKNLEIQYKTKLFQLEVEGLGLTMQRSSATICEKLDGGIEILYKNRSIPYHTLALPDKQLSTQDAKTINKYVDDVITEQNKQKNLDEEGKYV